MNSPTIDKRRRPSPAWRTAALLGPWLLGASLVPAAPAAAQCLFGGTSSLPAPAVEWLRADAVSFRTPTGLAVDAAGRIYVADPAAGRVVVRDAEGRVLTVGRNLGNPVSVAVTAAGDRIYVGDGAAGRVTAHAADFQPLLDLGQGDGELGLPGDLALDPATGDVWVVDSTGHRVAVYDADGGTRFDFGERGTGNGQFQYPAGIFIDVAADEVLIADQHNGRIQVFGRDGAFLYCLGEKGAGSGRFNVPQGVWADDLGRIFVADAFEGWVHVVDRTGATVALVGDVNAVGVGPGQLTTPSDLVLDPSGRLLVSLSTTARVEMFGVDAYTDPERFIQAGVAVRPEVFDPLVHATVAATIEAPGHDLGLLDLGSITGNGVPAIAGSPAIGDADGDRVPDVHALFDGALLAGTLPAEGEGIVRIAAQMGTLELEGFGDLTVDPSPDGDGDGVPDAADVCPGFDDSADADADGVPDDCDVCAGWNDAIDTDGDGIADGCDVCAGWNDAIDSDADGVPDGCDRCAGFDDALDADADGVPDACDRCPGFDDALDTDRDGIPNGCDPCVGPDDDGDGVPDDCDLCLGFDDAADADADGVPDGCDRCAGFDDAADGDGDGVPGGCDCDDARPEAAVTDGCGVCGGDNATCGIFFDGFESGRTGAWSKVTP